MFDLYFPMAPSLYLHQMLSLHPSSPTSTVFFPPFHIFVPQFQIFPPNFHNFFSSMLQWNLFPWYQWNLAGHLQASGTQVQRGLCTWALLLASKEHFINFTTSPHSSPFDSCLRISQLFPLTSTFSPHFTVFSPNITGFPLVLLFFPYIYRPFFPKFHSFFPWVPQFVPPSQVAPQSKKGAFVPWCADRIQSSASTLVSSINELQTQLARLSLSLALSGTSPSIISVAKINLWLGFF